MNAFSFMTAKSKFNAVAAIAVISLPLSALSSSQADEVTSTRSEAAQVVSATVNGGSASRVSTPSGGRSSWTKSSLRGWAATSASDKPSRIQTVSASQVSGAETGTEPGRGHAQTSALAGRSKQRSFRLVTSGRDQESSNASSGSESAALPELSATERFKRALAEQRRAMEEAAEADESEAVEIESSDEHAQEEKVSEDHGTQDESSVSPEALLGLSSSHSADLESEDPLRREKAERFLRLKMQILKLKAKVRNPVPVEAQSAESSHSSDAESSPAPAAVRDAEPDAQEAPHAVGHQTHSTDDTHVSAVEHDEHASENSTEHSEEIHSQLHAAEVPSHEEAHEDLSTSMSERVREHNKTQHSTESPTTQIASQHSAAPQKGVLKPIVEGPIDRLGLANNSYAIGEYAMALKMYHETSEVELSPAQEIWVEYQIANCQRRLGQVSEASNRYRVLASQPEAGWISEKSGWWVDVLEQIRQLQKSLQDDLENQPEAAGHAGPLTPGGPFTLPVPVASEPGPVAVPHSTPSPKETKHGDDH